MYIIYICVCTYLGFGTFQLVALDLGFSAWSLGFRPFWGLDISPVPVQ